MVHYNYVVITYLIWNKLNVILNVTVSVKLYTIISVLIELIVLVINSKLHNKVSNVLKNVQNSKVIMLHNQVKHVNMLQDLLIQIKCPEDYTLP